TLRAGREPANQEPSGLGTRTRDREVAHRVASGHDANPLYIGPRHDGAAAAADKTQSRAEGRVGRSGSLGTAARHRRPVLIAQGGAPRIRLKLARTLASISQMKASRVAKSGTSAARANNAVRPGAAALGSNGPARHRRRICVRS